MDLQEARQKLYDNTFVLGRMRRKAALKYLTETAETEAMHVLADALKKYKNPKEVESVLVKVEDSAKIDRLWQLWSDGRSMLLGDVLSRNGKEPSNEQLKILCLLKHNREGELPIDRKTLRSVSRFVTDRDEDVKKASIRYIQQIAASENTGTEGFCLKLLALSKLGRESELPLDLKSLRSAIGFVTDRDEDVKKASIRYIQQIAASEDTGTEGFCLKLLALSELGRESELPLDLKSLRSAMGFATYRDEDVKKASIRYIQQIAASEDTGTEGFCLKLLALSELGRESELPLDLKSLRSAMGFVADPDEDVVKAVVRFAERFPISEEFNDELFAAWIKTTSKYLQHVIQTQNRRPRSPSTEALFFLATGQTQRYQAMKDNDGGLFLEAWIMAPDALRRIINDTVAGSGDWRLAEAYEKALISREDFNIEVHVKALKTAKNDEKLFEAARYMRLPELLDLCEYWTSNQWQSADARVQKVVTVAVKAYRKMRAIPIKSADPLPSGAVDIFDFWKSQNPDDRELKAGFQSEDPFIRAKSLHIGHSKGLVSETDMARAEQSDHWPDRLWARMQFHLVGKAGPDHVEWIDTCTGIDGIMASARVACTPDEYESFKHQFERMVQSKASAADRSLYLLGILQAFQRYFNSGWIEVKEDDSAAESGAIEVMDAADLSF
jgi:hypothetical protein